MNMFSDLLIQLDIIPAILESQTPEDTIKRMGRKLIRAINSLPADVYPICVIDSLDLYQKQGYQKVIITWLNRWIKRFDQSAARLKLLLTIPFVYGGRHSLRK